MLSSFCTLRVNDTQSFAYSFIHLADVLVQRNFALSLLAQHMQAQISCDVLFVSKCSDISGVIFGVLSGLLLSLFPMPLPV